MATARKVRFGAYQLRHDLIGAARLRRNPKCEMVSIVEPEVLIKDGDGNVTFGVAYRLFDQVHQSHLIVQERRLFLRTHRFVGPIATVIHHREYVAHKGWKPEQAR